MIFSFLIHSPYLDPIMTKYSVLVFIVVMKLLSSVNGQEQTRTEDDMCGGIPDTLCVKDMLSNIAKAAKNIHKMANEIEDKIVNLIS